MEITYDSENLCTSENCSSFYTLPNEVLEKVVGNTSELLSSDGWDYSCHYDSIRAAMGIKQGFGLAAWHIFVGIHLLEGSVSQMHSSYSISINLCASWCQYYDLCLLKITGIQVRFTTDLELIVSYISIILHSIT